MLGESYPEAADHLRAAVAARDRLRDLWNTFFAGDLIDEFGVTDPDGHGRIVVAARWPSGGRAEMTEAFRTFVDELWACLDSLVTETVRGLGIFQRPRDAERSRFFPIADSRDGFDALLEEGCIDGILHRQQLLISDCQPFRDSATVPAAMEIRTALARLLAWTDRLHDGSLIGAWVTPVEPEVRVSGQRRLLGFEIASASALDDETVVATYDLTPGPGDVTTRTGSYVDVALTDGFDPDDADDTFDRRLTAMLWAIARFATYFARLVSEAGPLRRLADGSGAYVDTWVPADRSPHRWEPEELQVLQQSDIGLGVIRQANELTLLVTTEQGIFERRIPAVSPLNPHIKTGSAAELAAQNAAATWGLPDFVLLPEADHDGSRNREISDGLLLAGERGAVLQVKNRENPSDDPAKEASWLNKKITKAAGQIHGTVRRLRASPVEMTNGRHRRVHVDGTAVSWIGVVIIDHPAPPHDHPLQDQSRTGTGVVVLLRRDWEFLFDQLRSTRQVIGYLHRVAGPGPALGAEPERYFELAVADLEATPAPPEPHMEGEIRSLPLLPMEPADHANDPVCGIFRMICEDVANSPFDREEHERIDLLAAIDGLPVGHRRELGRLLLDELRAASKIDKGEIRWRFRRYDRGLHVPQLGFGVCSTSSETTRTVFRSWVELRHHERITGSQAEDALTIGVLLTARTDGVREWDTTLFAIRGDPGLDDDDLRQRRQLWDRHGPASLLASQPPR